jgi:hypothetical protein
VQMEVLLFSFESSTIVMSQISSFHVALLDGTNEQRPSAPASSSFHLRVSKEQIDIYTIGLSDMYII